MIIENPILRYGISALLLLIIIIWFVAVWYAGYKKSNRLTDPFHYVPDKDYQDQLRYYQMPYDPEKPILFLPEQFIGCYIKGEIIPTTVDREEKIRVMDALKVHYNLFFYVHEDEYYNRDAGERQLTDYHYYIEDHNLPISYIVYKLPDIKLLDDIEFNNGKYWLVVFNPKKI